jgi:hypothetical protein
MPKKDKRSITYVCLISFHLFHSALVVFLYFDLKEILCVCVCVCVRAHKLWLFQCYVGARKLKNYEKSSKLLYCVFLHKPKDFIYLRRNVSKIQHMILVLNAFTKLAWSWLSTIFQKVTLTSFSSYNQTLHSPYFFLFWQVKKIHYFMFYVQNIFTFKVFCIINYFFIIKFFFFWQLSLFS